MKDSRIDKPFLGVFWPEPEEPWRSRGVYNARCVEVSACSYGDSLEDAYRQLQNALSGVCRGYSPAELAQHMADVGSDGDEFLEEALNAPLSAGYVVKSIGVPSVSPLDGMDWSGRRATCREGVRLFSSREHGDATWAFRGRRMTDSRIDKPFLGVFCLDEEEPWRSRGTYAARCVEVNACTQGDSLEDAYQQLQEAIACVCDGDDPRELAEHMADCESSGHGHEFLEEALNAPLEDGYVVKAIGVPPASPLDGEDWSDIRATCGEGVRLRLERRGGEPPSPRRRGLRP